jgi:hypothetical protein
MTALHPNFSKPPITWLFTQLYRAPQIGMPDVLLVKLPSWWPHRETLRAYFIEEPMDLVQFYRGASSPARLRPDGTIAMKYLDALHEKPSRLSGIGFSLYLPGRRGWPSLVVNAGEPLGTSVNRLARGHYQWHAFSNRAEADAYFKWRMLNGINGWTTTS